MLVHEVMSTGLVTVKKTDTIRSAVMKMMHRPCGSLPVVEGDNQLVGVVTLRDVLNHCIRTMATIFTTTFTVGVLSRWRMDTPRCLAGKSRTS